MAKTQAISAARPAGSNTYLQFNDSGVFGGNTGLFFTKATSRFSVGAVPFRTPDESICTISKTYSSQTLLNMTEQVRSSIKTVGGGDVRTGRLAFSAWLEDAATVVNLAVTGAANNGAGLIRLTTATNAFATGDTVAVYSVTGTTEANGGWTITVIDTTHVDLQGSTFTNAYVSGGFITNASQMVGYRAALMPTTPRAIPGVGGNNADCNGFTVTNGGSAQATDAFWATDELAGGLAWRTIVSSDSRTEYVLRYTGTCDTIGIDFSTATMTGSAIKLGQAHQLILGTTVPTTLATRTITTDADGTVSAALFGSTVTKNDSNTRTFSVLKIAPTLNAGASNNNTSLRVLDVVPTNTAVTGILECLNIRSLITGTTPTTTAGICVENITATTSGASMLQRKARGSVGSESVALSGDVVGSMAWGSYDAATSGQPYPLTSNAQIRVSVTENQDTTHHGAKLELRTTAIASTTLTTRVTVDENGLTFADALNIITGTSTGMKIGTVGGSSGQKLGFFAATPIVQPLLATGAGKVVDDVITVLQNLGLCRQS